MGKQVKEYVLELLRRSPTSAEYNEIRELWKAHSIAEDNRDIQGLISTLTTDCIYEVVNWEVRWEGHSGATDFYTTLLGAFPDIQFTLTDIVVGPQGVCEEASATGTHKGDWLDWVATGERVEFEVIIFFPWDRAAKKFRGEKIYVFPRRELDS